MAQFGLHLRVADSLVAVAHQAIALELAYFQAFLMTPDKQGTLIVPSEREITQFRKLCEKRFERIYGHASFWLNLADPARSSLDGLWRQVMLAQRLGFTHLIVHPGSCGSTSKKEGIEMVARTLNQLFRRETTIMVVLENTAHGNRAVGSDLADLAQMRSLLDRPDRVQFCLDTAHAHAYGYTVNDAVMMHQFLQMAESLLGTDALALLHLNDASDQIGSGKDRHAVLGEGTIGQPALEVAYHFFGARKIPIILEPPVMSDPALEQLYKKVQNW